MTDTENTPHALGHLVFCALIALALERQQGGAATPFAENLFLLRWLATAQKQKRFPKTVAVDIAWMLERGRQYGPTGKLRQHLEYLWRSSCNLETQSDLFRLTHAIETLKDQGWHNTLLDAKTWQAQLSLPAELGDGIFVEKQALSDGYTQEGQHIQPVVFRVVGEVAAVIEHLAGYRLTGQHTGTVGGYHTLVLLPTAACAAHSDEEDIKRLSIVNRGKHPQ